MKIGKYLLSEITKNEDAIFISIINDGEGMSVTKKRLEECLDKFYKEEM